MFAENVNFAAKLKFVISEQLLLLENISGLRGKEKMWPVYFGRESMFSESDSEIPGTVSAATRAISFKVIPDFQSENCNFHSVTYICVAL